MLSDKDKLEQADLVILWSIIYSIEIGITSFKEIVMYILKWISEIHAISQNGLTYSRNEFDIERYNQLERVAKEMAAYFSDKNIDDVEHFFSLEKGYATPKLDVRAFILKDGQLLLAKERSDNLWTLPGGWVDVNESPSESVVREVLEETGFNVRLTGVNHRVARSACSRDRVPQLWYGALCSTI
ncbi:NUDIX hydrolase [Legionella shakespearei]|uniref:Mutator MutT protein n=1 Tax=Legionella shakespearei DSM 23087 TaxID=1122169 RepID=A0A0W0YVI8_9GAMM|nr:NUDIX hydrolase N-terminal domain-containing protein [Legionella shakespearei]KTD60928.1 Mutator MutT protein [Legionella shakespearei DSM 23087]